MCTTDMRRTWMARTAGILAALAMAGALAGPAMAAPAAAQAQSATNGATTSRPTGTAPASQSPAVLLEQGIYAEQTKGDVDEAIRLYQQVIAAGDANRRTAGEALWRLGQCWEKKQEPAKAAEAYATLVWQYRDQTALVVKANEKLRELRAAQAQLPPEVIMHIVVAHMDAYGRANARGLAVNAHIYGVDDRGTLYFGGLLLFHNSTTVPRIAEADIGGFSDQPTFDLVDERGELQRYRTEERFGALGRYRLWWTPSRPVAPGETRVLGYKNRTTRQLPPAPEGGYALTMQNQLGTPGIESFFLVVPPTIAVAQAAVPFDKKVRLGAFDVYLWQREVFADTTNRVEVRLVPGGEAPASRPAGPVVVFTSPAALADNVDPGLTEITVTFDRPMLDRRWSWTGGGDTYPRTTGSASYNAARTTCTLPVKLEAGKVYWVGINSPSHRNFKSTDGTPAPWYAILFATRGADGSPTPLPADRLERARAINAAHQARANQSAPGVSAPVFTEEVEAILPHPVDRKAELLDLDTDRRRSMERFGANDRETHAWIRQERMDLLGVNEGPKGYGVLGTDLAAVPSTKPWEQITLQDVLGNWLLEQKEPPKIEQMDRGQDPNHPTVWLFRTREGTHGVLQVLDSTTEPRGVKIRYKRVAYLSSLPASGADADSRVRAERLAVQGWAFWRQGKHDQAEQLFEQSVKLDAGQANAWNGLGWARFNQGLVEGAREAFERALAIEPNHPAALNGMGWIAKGKSDTDAAVEYWQKAVAAAPSATAALMGLAQTALDNGDTKQAADYFRRILKLEPDNAEAKAGLAKSTAAGRPAK